MFIVQVLSSPADDLIFTELTFLHYRKQHYGRYQHVLSILCHGHYFVLLPPVLLMWFFGKTNNLKEESAFFKKSPKN